eukprot:9902848-Alexandrium_andersonii.AAC.1
MGFHEVPFATFGLSTKSAFRPPVPFTPCPPSAHSPTFPSSPRRAQRCFNVPRALCLLAPQGTFNAVAGCLKQFRAFLGGVGQVEAVWWH